MGLFSKHTQPIRATRGSLESLLGSASNDTTTAENPYFHSAPTGTIMVGNGSGYFEIQAGEDEFAQPKKWHFGHFGPFWTKSTADMWEIERSILNQSRPLEGRWKAYWVARLTTPQWSGMVQATSRYGWGKLTLLNPKNWHFWSF